MIVNVAGRYPRSVRTATSALQNSRPNAGPLGQWQAQRGNDASHSLPRATRGSIRGRPVASPTMKELIVDLWMKASAEGLCARPSPNDRVEFVFSTTGISLLLKLQGPTSDQILGPSAQH